MLAAPSRPPSGSLGRYFTALMALSTLDTAGQGGNAHTDCSHSPGSSGAARGEEFSPKPGLGGESSPS